MPLYLHLLRHGQSADKQIGQVDKERTLTSAGFTESQEAGKFLKEKSLIPDLIMSSTAVRAKATAEIVADILTYNLAEIIFREDLYKAEVVDFFRLTIDLNDKVRNLLIVGHNPAITLFLNLVTNQHNSSLIPSELAILKFECRRWNDIQKRKAELLDRFHSSV